MPSAGALRLGGHALTPDTRRRTCPIAAAQRAQCGDPIPLGAALWSGTLVEPPPVTSLPGFAFFWTRPSVPLPKLART